MAGLRRIGDESILPIFYDFMNHDDSHVRMEAMTAIFNIESANTQDALIAALSDENEEIRTLGMDFLRQTEDYPFIKVFTFAFLGDEDYLWNGIPKEILLGLVGEDPIEKLRELLHESEVYNIRNAALKTLEVLDESKIEAH
jgi:HEAT repeat protein